MASFWRGWREMGKIKSFVKCKENARGEKRCFIKENWKEKRKEE